MVTSGLHMQCLQHHSPRHRQQTGTLFNSLVLTYPADMQTQCYSIKRFDYLHRALKQSYQSITMLSLGRLHISYRLLIVLTHNLPDLEHLELISCASKFELDNNKRTTPRQTLHTNDDHNNQLPTLESFNNSTSQASSAIYSTVMYNQHEDERINMQERLIRSTLVKSCQLVQEARRQRHWSKMKHLLVKDCNLLNEFSLCLILAITSQTLDHLAVESNQYLTGEFLNYCGPQLKILRLKNCPMLRLKFLEDLVRLKQLLAPTNGHHGDARDNNQDCYHSKHSSSHLGRQPTNSNIASHPKPINTSMFRNHRDFSQDIYCTL